MPDPTITNVDLGNVILANAKFKAEVVRFPGADAYAEGTIMARKAVADAITAAPDGGNTGDGTCTAATVVAGQVVPVVGAYNLECISAVANGGVFKLEDPNGALVADPLTMTAGAGAATVFEVAGMTFTLTDGATDFIVGDKFSLTVAADGRMYVYTPTGLGGTQIPSMILTYDLSSAGADDVSARLLIAGEVRKEKLVLDDGSTVTNAILDQLRDFTIVPQNILELNVLDNQ